jgi:hypothetical protein
MERNVGSKEEDKDLEGLVGAVFVSELEEPKAQSKDHDGFSTVPGGMRVQSGVSGKEASIRMS